MISESDIRSVDKEDMLGSIKSLNKQIDEGIRLANDIEVGDDFDEILITGMGGSALPGLVLQSLMHDSHLKITVNRDYKIPKWANEKTLVFAISYSGNTEETLSAFKDAVKKKCKVIAMSSGGKLRELARKEEVDYIKMPKPFEGFQPRAAIGYLFFALLGVLIKNRICDPMVKEIVSLKNSLDAERYINSAEDLASQIYGKVPIIYTSERLAAAGYKWKIAFNENAKTHAFFNTYPEANHNEINAYINLNTEYFVVMLSDDSDHKQVQKRMDITKKLYNARGVDVTEIRINGESHLSKLFSAIVIGDLVSYFIAIKTDTDPTPVEMVEGLKKQL